MTDTHTRAPETPAPLTVETLAQLEQDLVSMGRAGVVTYDPDDLLPARRAFLHILNILPALIATARKSGKGWEAASHWQHTHDVAVAALSAIHERAENERDMARARADAAEARIRDAQDDRNKAMNESTVAYETEERLREVLDEIALTVSYMVVHGVASEPGPRPEGGGPQVMPVTPQEAGALIHRIGNLARAALAASPEPVAEQGQPREFKMNQLFNMRDAAESIGTHFGLDEQAEDALYDRICTWVDASLPPPPVAPGQGGADA